MKFKVKCPNCDYDNHLKQEDIVEMELVDSNYYLVKCQQGHTNHILLNQEKYELLFEVGCLAYLDGYYREAVTSFSAALENFRDFSIDFFMTSNGVSVEQLNEAKKETYLSERQFGAFNMLYLNYFKEPINAEVSKALKTRWTKFRNKATHVGVIPQPEEVWEYANFVHDFILGTVEKMKNANHDHLINRYFRRKDEQIQNMNIERDSIMNFGLLSVLNVASSRKENLNFSMDLLKAYREKLYTR